MGGEWGEYGGKWGQLYVKNNKKLINIHVKNKKKEKKKKDYIM